MNDELLRRAARSLREETAPVPGGGEETLARVIGDLRASGRRRRMLRLILLQLGFGMIGAFAWAASSGGLAPLVERISGWSVREEAPSGRRAPLPSRVTAAPPALGEPPGAAPAAERTTPSSDSFTEPTSRPAPIAWAREPQVRAEAEAPRGGDPGRKGEGAEAGARPRSVGGGPQPGRRGRLASGSSGLAAAAPSKNAARAPDRFMQEPEATAPIPPPGPNLARSSDALYAEAHEAHFVRRDFAAAVVAWERYLRAPTPGRFALEARWNRATAFVRLGRRAEAAEALRPFAEGDYGAYRQAEARELLRLVAGPP